MFEWPRLDARLRLIRTGPNAACINDSAKKDLRIPATPMKESGSVNASHLVVGDNRSGLGR